MKGKYIKPEVGKTYCNRTGGVYKCTAHYETGRLDCGEHTTTMVREPDGWALTAHGVQQYEDGTVEWNYSTGGHWSKGFLG